jgi:membrane protease YdiL (CAAX protease family)
MRRFPTPTQIRLIPAGLGILVLTWLLLQFILAAPGLPFETRLLLLAGLALLFLILAVFLLSFGLRQRQPNPAAREFLPVGVVLALAYGLPLLVLGGLNLALGQATRPQLGWWGAVVSGPEIPYAPWIYLWQTLVLAWSAWSARPPAPFSAPAPAGDRSPLQQKIGYAWAGVLVGLGIALSGTYVLGMLPSPAAPVLHPALNLVLIVAAVSLAPWAEEHFFRQQLPAAWSARLGPAWAAILVAFVFAAVQVRPFSFLPAFLLGLGLAALRSGTNRLYPGVLAHILFNVLWISATGLGI